jgi:hypothetical protein
MPRIPRQEKLEGRHFLRDFVTDALSTLASDAYVDEVVHLAGDVVELEFDAKTRPETIHPLPEGYEYPN